MKDSFESTATNAQAEGERKKFDSLSELISRDIFGPPPGQPAQESRHMISSPNPKDFKVSSIDVEHLLADEKISLGLIHGGVTRADLKEISKAAHTSGDARKEKTAAFLDTHFDDITKLSSQGDQNIARADFGLYQAYLRHQELKDTPRNPDLEGWKQIHLNQEKKNTVIPYALEVASNTGMLSSWSRVKEMPSVAARLNAFKAASPVAFYGTLTIAALGIIANNRAVSRDLGEKASAYINGDAIEKHFYDESAPAMKRLLGKSHM